MSNIPSSTPDVGTVTPKRHFLDALAREHRVTQRVLRSLPAERADYRPTGHCKTAGELAGVFVAEQRLAEKALTTGFDWSAPPSPTPLPTDYAELLEEHERGHHRLVELVEARSDEELRETVTFPVGPGAMGEWPKIRFLWMILFDQIHHRGQFSVYLRAAGEKVPAIYGPSADEPWF